MKIPYNRASPEENRPTSLRSRKCIPPLVAGATTLPGGKHVTGFAGRLQLPYESSSFATPASGGTITLAYCRAIYEESVSRCFILPPLAGEVRRSRIGVGERSEPITRMRIMPYDL